MANRQLVKLLIILGTHRTGSNFLADVLNRNDGLILGEIFDSFYLKNQRGHLVKGRSIYDLLLAHEVKKTFKSRFKYPPVFLWQLHRLLTKRFGKNWIGFRLFYSQINASRRLAVSLWIFRYIPGIRFLHIKRRNICQLYISHQLANQRNKFGTLNTEELVEDKIQFKIEAFEKFESNYLKEQRKWKRFLGNRALNIDYEDLITDEKTWHAIGSFMGLSQIVAESVLKKQILNYNAHIQNFEEVREYLAEKCNA